MNPLQQLLQWWELQHIFNVSRSFKGQILWVINQFGERERIFCKQCLSDGKDWLSPEPCEHILKAQGHPADPQQVKDAIQDISSLASGAQG